MTTTPLGIPKYALTDNADIAAKLNAIADSVDGLLTSLQNVVSAQSFPPVNRKLARTSPYTVNTGTNPISLWDDTTPSHVFNIGDTTYGSGIITIHTPGQYVWFATVDTPGDPSAGRLDLFVQKNGATANEGANDMILPTNHSMNLTAGGVSMTLAAGDTLQLCMFYSASASLANVQPKFFEIRRVA